MASRLSLDTYFMEMAKLTAKRSTCLKRQVGCVIIRDKRVIATGYNGSLPGQPHCIDVGCELDERGKCIRCLHAEINALLQCAKLGQSSDGADAYVTCLPCRNCAMALAQAGVRRVIFMLNTPAGMSKSKIIEELLEASGVQLLVR